jgi:DNA polymerase-1
MPHSLDPETTLYLVDGTSNLFRAFYAIRSLSNSRGLPTNAVYGFTSMLRKLLREHRPRLLAVAFDLAEPTFRHRAYADYKANRSEPPEELVAQIPYVKRVCRVLGIPTLEMAGYEADDLIGTLAERARRERTKVVIVACDKDLLQLVGGGVLMYNPVKDQLLDSDDVVRTFGVMPAQVRDVLALAGDASDNIPGVPGIGDKGAKDLIRQYGDLETLLREAPKVQRKSYREGLQKHADAAHLSRDLATVQLDVPVSVDPLALVVKPPDTAAARELFLELEFESLALEFTTPISLPEGDHNVILTAEVLARTVESLRAAGKCAINLERDPQDPMRAALIGITLTGPGGEGAGYVPLAHRHLGAPAQLPPSEAMRLLRPLLTDRGLRRIGHDVKPDLILLRRLGAEIAGFDFDTMIASYLLNPSRRSHALEAIAQDAAGLSVPNFAALLGSGAKSVPLAEIDIERTAGVACPRAVAVLTILDRLEASLKKDGLMPLLVDLEMPLVSVLADMELRGVAIDSSFFTTLSARWEDELRRLTGEIHAAAGREFNINSPKQLGEILFTTLGLRPGKKTQKTRSFSTGVEVLEELARSHELPRRILEYRSLQKLKSTYVDALPQLINPETGRVHTSFNQTVAATGRLSSSEPNLQNIPIRTELGRQIRRAFVPGPGCLLLSADYSQIELRVLARLCDDPALRASFRDGEDIHRRTAAEVFGVLPGLVSDEMRRRAKAVNFGIIYGMGAQRLAREQGMPLKEASRFIAEYFSRFPRVKQYIDATVAQAESEGHVRTLLRRVRYLPELKGADRNARQQAIRAAVNTTIQGTAADIIKVAMVDLHRRLLAINSRARMILQVHDELLLEVPEQDLKEAAALVRKTMEAAHPIGVPLKVDLRAGPNWLDLRSIP